MGIFSHPVDISSKGTIGEYIFLSRRLKYIYRESELMLAMSGWRAERITTATLIPEPLLICCTSVSTHDDEWSLELE
jgi:hypothetical protein